MQARQAQNLDSQVRFFGEVTNLFLSLTIAALYTEAALTPILASEGIELAGPGVTAAVVIFRREWEDRTRKLNRIEWRQATNTSLDYINGFNFDINLGNTKGNARQKFSFNIVYPNFSKSNVQLGLNYPLIELRIPNIPWGLEIYKMDLAVRGATSPGEGKYLSIKAGFEVNFLTFGKLAVTLLDLGVI